MPQPLKGTFTCYRCGQRFDNEHKRRRKVQTGSSWGRSYRAYYRTVNLCPECDSQEERKERREWLILGAVALIILAYIYYATFLRYGRWY